MTKGRQQLEKCLLTGEELQSGKNSVFMVYLSRGVSIYFGPWKPTALLAESVGLAEDK